MAAAPLGVPPSTAHGQAPASDRPVQPPARARAVQHTLTVGALARGYRVGDTTVAERTGSIAYTLSAGRLRLRASGSALRFTTPLDTIQGAPPAAVRADYLLRPGDTLTVFGRTSSRPGTLSARQTSAIGAAGTSTLDLDGFSLGTPAVGGARLSLAFPVGQLVLGARAGVETEPRPGGADPVYWRGTTARGGVSLTGGATSVWSGAVDVTRSVADSLGGRNLFPGGGTLSLQLSTQAELLNPLDPLRDERWPVSAVAFYVRPFGNSRNDQPNRLIPSGDLVGALATLLVPVRAVTVAPSIQLLHESSRSSTTGTGRALLTTIDGSGWAASLGIDVTIPVGRFLEITPQAGLTGGNVGATFSQDVVTRRGRTVGRSSSSFSDAVRGGWAGLELSATF